jgi:hypothetical protein
MDANTHPIAYKIVKHLLDWAEANDMYVSKADLFKAVMRDSNWASVIAEATDPAHPNADVTTRMCVYQAMNDLLHAGIGWFSCSVGRGAQWFHESFGTPQDWRENCNLRIRGRDNDEAALQVALATCQAECKKHGMRFDPQYDPQTNELVRVEVW